MRITDSMRLSVDLLNESRASQNLYVLTEESSSGNLISEPSDNPNGFETLVSLDSQITIMQGRNTAMSTASGDLNTASDALASAGDILDQAQSLAIQASNGSYSATDRAAAATQVDALVQQMIQIGNTKGANGYLFGGTQTDTPPFDPVGNFSGNGAVKKIEVADGILASASVSGAQAFTAAGGSNVIADLQSLATALTANNVAGITASIAQMQSDQAQVSEVQVEAGALSANFQTTSALLTTSITSAESTASTIDNAATPAVYSELQAAQSSYQAAISVTQQVLSMRSFQSSIA